MMRRFSSLKRPPPSRQPKIRFVIFCEGKNTEPEYFKNFQRKNADVMITLAIHEAVGTAFTIAQKAVKEAKLLRKTRDSASANDQVWAVFDRDEVPRWDEARNLCEQNNVMVAYSDPCFELWLILHHQDYDKSENHRNVQAFAEQIVGGYTKDRRKIANGKELLTLVEAAETRAELQLRRRFDEGRAFGCPSTTVGRLTFAIRTFSRALTLSVC